MVKNFAKRLRTVDTLSVGDKRFGPKQSSKCYFFRNQKMHIGCKYLLQWKSKITKKVLLKAGED